MIHKRFFSADSGLSTGNGEGLSAGSRADSGLSAGSGVDSVEGEVISSTPANLDSGFTTYFHAVNSGDLVAAMAAFKEVWRKTGRKAVIYQQLNRAGNYYPGAVHPVRSEAGEMVTMNKAMFDLIRPLLLSQPYIEDFRVWSGEKYSVNLDRIHGEVFVNMPHGSINRWLFYAFPDMACDLSKPWVELRQPLGIAKLIEDHSTEFSVVNETGIKLGRLDEIQKEVSGKIIVNRTQRYHNDKITYHFLRPMEDRCIFAGTNTEHNEFCKEWKLQIPRLEITNFLELAYALKFAKMFLGNQSMCWNIAEAMKIPRVLEICPFAENCIPCGTDGYDFYYTGAMEYYVEQIMSGNG